MKEYIEREAIKEVVSNLRWSKHLNKDAALNLVDRAIDNLPAADVVERKRGEWIERKSLHAEGGISAKCSVCQKDVQYLGNPLNFCPNCGADMREVDHETD